MGTFLLIFYQFFSAFIVIKPVSTSIFVCVNILISSGIILYFFEWELDQAEFFVLFCIFIFCTFYLYFVFSIFYLYLKFLLLPVSASMIGQSGAS